MSIISHSVLLLKAQKSDCADKYEEILELNGFQVKQIKTLDFVYKNLETLKLKLENPHEFDGIIFSSPRCVEAVHQSNTRDKLDEWKFKDNFAVGEATAKDAFEKLGLECKGKESGNAHNLAQIIIKNSGKFYLFPHGNLKTDTLNVELQKHGIKMDNVLVYDTVVNPTIEDDFQKITEEYQTIPEFIVFFSPSGFRGTIDLIRKIPVNLDKLKFIAIGPVTQLAVEESDLHLWGVAKNPTPNDVLNAILHKL